MNCEGLPLRKNKIKKEGETVSSSHAAAVATVKYIDFLPRYLGQMVELGEERFGEKYTNEDKLRAYIEKKDNICKLAVDAENDRLIGFFLMHGVSLEDLAREFKLTTREIIDVIGANKKICVAKSLVLQKDAEKSGIATELAQKGLKKAKIKGFYSCWSPLWIRKDGAIPAQHVIERIGFIFYKIVHMLWVDDKNYRCLDCNGPCKCDASVYYKIL